MVGLQHFNIIQANRNIAISIIIEKASPAGFENNNLWFREISIVNLAVDKHLYNGEEANNNIVVGDVANDLQPGDFKRGSRLAVEITSWK